MGAETVVAVVVVIVAAYATVRWRAAVVRELRAIRRDHERADEDGDDGGA